MITNFEGTLNAATINCNISNEGRQISTQWNLRNYGPGDSSSLVAVSNAAGAAKLIDIGGDPIPGFEGVTYNNQLTVLNLTSELDKVIVFCGTGQQQTLANFTLRIYRKSRNN